MLSVLAALILSSLAVQLAALWGMGRRRPIGDEVTYLARARSDDPHAPRLFLRPPLLPWLAAVCHRGAGHPDAGEGRLRLVMAAASFLTVVWTAVAGWWLGGPAVALLSALLVAAQPERILLGCHIWPDTLLALTLAALGALLMLPAEAGLALAAGGVATLGVLVRIDFVVALPLVLAAWRESHGPLDAGAVAALLAPPLLSIAVLSGRNYRRYGIPLPDTTWAFNLMVARSEARLGDRDSFTIERAVEDAVATWRRLDAARVTGPSLAALREVLRSPRRLGRGVVRRLLTLFGPDTFVRQKLLPSDAAYPDLGEWTRRRWDAALRVAFPLLVTAVLITLAAGLRVPGSFAWPSLGLMAVAVLVHARTRYRVAVMPALSLVAASEAVRLGGSLDGRPGAAAMILVGGLVLFAALLRIRCSAEQPAE